MASLEQREHRVRDVLNAGIVLFDQSDMVHRGKAIMIAHGMIKEELQTAIQRIKDTVNWMDNINNPDAFSDHEKQIAATAKQLIQGLESILRDK